MVAQETKPILDIPEDWRFERITLPFDFAPEMPYTGFEELRFAPGMFDRSSENYFTYLFIASIKNEKKFSKRAIKNFLTQYYQGLSKAVAGENKEKLDFSNITISVKRNRTIKRKQKNYIATIVYLDTFNKGEEVILNMELTVVSNKKNPHTYLMVMVSPQEKNHSIWDFMRETLKKITLPKATS